MADENNTQPDQSTFEKHFWLWIAAILAVAGATYLHIAAKDPIFERAEDFFTECAREMWVMGKFITPYMYGVPFIDKPILSYWGMEGSFALFGVSHFTCRIPFTLAALACLALTAQAVAQAWGRKIGVVAALLLSSSVGFFYFATLAMSDMWLTLCCTGAVAWFFAGSVRSERRTRDWAIASVWCAFAVLAKGPVGLVLPVGGFGAYLLIRRELGQIRPRHLLIGFAALMGIAGSWFAALWAQNGPGLLLDFLFRENLRRFAGQTYQININRPFGYIPLALLVYFLPYTLLLFFAFADSRRKWRGDWNSRESRAELLLWCYIAVIVAVFGVARSVNDYYVLPAMPACAALGAVYFTRAAARRARPLIAGCWLLVGPLLGAAAVASVALLVVNRRHADSLAPGLLPLVLWVVAAAAGMTLLLRARKFLALPAVVLLTLSGCSVLVLRAVIPVYQRAFPVALLAQAVAADQPGKPLGTAPLAISGDLEHWRRELAFQTTRVPEELDRPEALADFLRGPGPRLALVTDEAMSRLPQDVNPACEEAHDRVVYRTDMLMRGAPLRLLLEPGLLDSKMRPVSWIYRDGPDETKPGGDTPSGACSRY